MVGRREEYNKRSDWTLGLSSRASVGEGSRAVGEGSRAVGGKGGLSRPEAFFLYGFDRVDRCELPAWFMAHLVPLVRGGPWVKGNAFYGKTLTSPGCFGIVRVLQEGLCI